MKNAADWRLAGEVPDNDDPDYFSDDPPGKHSVAEWTAILNAQHRERIRINERQRIATYLLEQLLGAGHDTFDVTLAPSVVRAVAERIPSGEYQ